MVHPKKILDAYQVDPKKSLGQNFLFDERILSRLVKAARIGPGDTVLEIGPGIGALTGLLAENAGQVVAVEIDERLIPILQQELARYAHVSIVEGDILQFDPADWFEKDNGYTVVANVPYYITGAIFEHFLGRGFRPDRLVLTVQKDVAERLVATPPDMSILAVSVQFYGRPEILFNLSAGAFWPRPRVASSAVVIDTGRRPAGSEQIEDDEFFFRLVNLGFSQKRKQIHNNLQRLGLDKAGIGRWLRRAGIDGRRRAETLEVEEWIALYQFCPLRPGPRLL